MNQILALPRGDYVIGRLTLCSVVLLTTEASQLWKRRLNSLQRDQRRLPVGVRGVEEEGKDGPGRGNRVGEGE